MNILPMPSGVHLVPHAPYNLSDKECLWIVVHSSGDYQDEIIRVG